MQNSKYMYKNDRVTRRYSEPFKLTILAELVSSLEVLKQEDKRLSAK